MAIRDPDGANKKDTAPTWLEAYREKPFSQERALLKGGVKGSSGIFGAKSWL